MAGRWNFPLNMLPFSGYMFIFGGVISPRHLQKLWEPCNDSWRAERCCICCCVQLQSRCQRCWMLLALFMTAMHFFWCILPSPKKYHRSTQDNRTNSPCLKAKATFSKADIFSRNRHSCSFLLSKLQASGNLGFWNFFCASGEVLLLMNGRGLLP